MGNLCYAKNKKTRTDILKFRTADKDEIFCKPKASSSSLVCYKPKNKTFWEESINSEVLFQSGCMFAPITENYYLCIGGVENGELCTQLSLSPKTISKLSSPPYSLAYGSMNFHEGIAYIIGAITRSPSGQELPAPYLKYSLKLDKWELIQSPPLLLALAGSYISESKIFIIGGFLDYPEYPKPFTSLMMYSLNSKSWLLTNIKSPIANGLPSCITTPMGIMIVGGHDPFDHYIEESREVFLFVANNFRHCLALPEIGQLRFTGPGAYINGEVYLYSEDEILFSYNIAKDVWTFIDLEEKLTVTGEMPVMQVLSGYGEHAYFYSHKDCDLLEYSIKQQSARTTGPATFHKFPKYPGVGLLADGRVLIAGGLDEQQRQLKSCWILEPQFHQSSTIQDLPAEQYGLSILQISREIFAISGMNDSKSFSQKYSLDSEQWKMLPAMPYATFLPGCGCINGKIFCVGGCAEEEGASILYLVQSFCIKTEVWEVLSVEYPFGVLAPGVVTMNNSKLLCFGGMCKGGYKVLNTYYFDGNRFSLVGELPEDDDPESTCFRDPAVLNGNFVYAFAKNAKLYKFDVQECVWTVEYPTSRI